MSTSASLVPAGIRSVIGEEKADLAAHFSAHRYAVIRGALGGPVVDTYRRYLTLEIARGTYQFGDRRSDRWRRYRDPASEALLRQAAGPLSHLLDQDLIPSYSYTVVYPPGSQLPVHTDRTACEFSVSLTIANRKSNHDADPWPLYLRDPMLAETVPILLSPGDLVVYRGCEVPHYRHPQAEGCFNYSVLLHFVDGSGPWRDYAWDQTPDG